MLTCPTINTFNRNNFHILLTNIDFIMIFIFSVSDYSYVPFSYCCELSHLLLPVASRHSALKYECNNRSGLNNTKVSDTDNHYGSPADTRVLHSSQHVHKALSLFIYLYILIGLHA
jgi:hypothetical protein